MTIATLLASFASAAAADNIGYRGGVELAHGSGVFTGTKPAGVAVGDVMYAAFLHDSGALPSQAGWTQLSTANTPSNGFACSVLRRVADGTEPSTISIADGGSVGDGVLVVFSGPNATPEDATTTSATGTAASLAYPSITTVHANSWHLAIGCNFNAVPGTPTGYTSRQASGRWIRASTNKIAAAGAVSGITSTGGADWVGFSIAIRTS